MYFRAALCTTNMLCGALELESGKPEKKRIFGANNRVIIHVIEWAFESLKRVLIVESSTFSPIAKLKLW